MLESLFIILFIVAIIIFILGIIENAIAYQGISLIMFLTVIVASLGIEIPYVIATDTTTYVENTIVVQDYTFNAFSWVFVFIDIIALILNVMDWNARRKGPAVP